MAVLFYSKDPPKEKFKKSLVTLSSKIIVSGYIKTNMISDNSPTQFKEEVSV